MRIFRAPTLYVQGPGALSITGERASALGRNLTVIGDAMVLPGIQGMLNETLKRQDISATIVPFSGDVTYRAMDGLAAQGRLNKADVIVGVGGGRTLDAAKGASRRLGLPFVSVPTAASTDAPATRGIVIYDEAHTMVAVEQMDDNPACIIVDTALIAAAPARLLRGGIGDALTAKFEAEGCLAGTGFTKAGTRPLRTGLILAEGLYRTLLDFGVEAMAAAGTGEPTQALENVVEAVLFMSAVAFENTGLSLAHALATELGVVGSIRAASLHGEHAAYGTLVQAVAEQRAEKEIAELISFMDAINMPRSLRSLGLSAYDEAQTIAMLAERSAASPMLLNLAKPLDGGAVLRAIVEVEARAAKPLDPELVRS